MGRNELTEEEKTFIKSKLSILKEEDLIKFITDYKNYELKGDILGRIFERLYVNKEGFSKSITMSELETIHPSFHTTNGGDWCRSKQSYLGKRYIIVRTKKGGRITEVKCDGPERLNKAVEHIRKDISTAIKKQRCVILDISTNIECDHKEGMKDDSRLNDLDSQKLDDFQPLCKTANDAKRSHCKKCQLEHKRYDAKKLGYSASFIYGDENSKTCVGCYWHDPVKFNKVISKGYKKEK